MVQKKLFHVLNLLSSSLRVRLISFTVSVIAVILLVTAFLIDRNMESFIEKSSNENLKSICLSVSSTVTVWLQPNLNALHYLVSLPDITGMDAKKQKPVLEKMSEAYPYMYLVSTLDMNGKNVARSDHSVLMDYSDRNWFIEAREGKPVSFESLIGRTKGKPALVVAMPVRDSGGRITGVGMFATELEGLAEKVRVNKIERTGYAYLVDEKNRVIAHPEASYTSELRDLSGYPPVASGLVGKFTFRDDTGLKWISYINKLSNGWGVIVQQQENELQENLKTFRQTMVIITLFSLLFLILITSWIISGTLKPIQTLTQAVKIIVSENLSHPAFEDLKNATLNIPNKGEVGILAENFNRMTEQLEGALTELKREVDTLKRTEKLLSESEEKFRTLVNNINVGIYRTTGSQNGRFIQINPAMAKIFGYDSAEELIQIPVNKIYEKAEDREAFIRELIQKGSLWNKEIQMKKKDGTTIWCSISAKVVLEENQKLKWLDGIIEDITDKKKIEKQLIQSQKMEAVSTLSRGFAHDFNNILTIITGYGNLLRDQIGQNNPFREYLDGILTAADRASKLTYSLLSFSRKKSKTGPENLHSIIKNIERLLIQLIGEDIEYRSDLYHEELIIIADAGQIEQVLLNLVTNARDSMPNGGRLTIRTEKAEFHQDSSGTPLPDGLYAVLSVSDTGTGMDEETQKRAFEPFFTTKEEGKGTGLGLFTAYGIISQHNGKITITSEPGNGTTVQIFLKLSGMKTENGLLESHVYPPGGTETLLIAEDDMETRHLFRSILNNSGYTVLEAADGEEAVNLFKENGDKIRLLIFDVVMPKKNGNEAYDAIRKIKDDVPVLFSSGYSPEIVNTKGMEKDSDIIFKPVSQNTLLEKVREILDKNIKGKSI